MVCHFLTHGGRLEHICIGKLITIGSDNGLLLEWHQAIIWTNAVVLLTFNGKTNIFFEENTFENVVCEML